MFFTCVFTIPFVEQTISPSGIVILILIFSLMFPRRAFQPSWVSGFPTAVLRWSQTFRWIQNPVVAVPDAPAQGKVSWPSWGWWNLLPNMETKLWNDSKTRGLVMFHWFTDVLSGVAGISWGLLWETKIHKHHTHPQVTIFDGEWTILTWEHGLGFPQFTH